MKNILYLVFSLSFFFSQSIVATAKQLPIEAFAKPVGVSHVRLSPDGKHIAYIAHVATSELMGYVVSVVNVDTKERKNYSFTDNSVFRYTGLSWLNSNTLTLVVNSGVLKGGVTSFDTLMYKLNITTGKLDDLVPESLFKKRGNLKPTYYGYIVDVIEADSDHFLFATSTARSKGTEIFLISLKGDEPVLVQKGLSRYYSWMTDQQSRIRLAKANIAKDKTRIMLRGIDGSSFRILWEFDDNSDQEVIPIGFDFDPNILFIKAKLNSKWVIYKVDVSDKNLSRVMVYDNPDNVPLGTIRYSAAKRKATGVGKGVGRGFIFWDKEHKGLYDTINEALPNLRNNFYGFSRDENRLLVLSNSDVESGAYYVWDRTTKVIDLLSYKNEFLPPEDMTKQVYTKFVNREGIELPVIYTFPSSQNQKRPTLIVLGKEPDYLFTWGFYKRAQFLANRGYNVVHLDLREPSSKDNAYLKSGIVGWGADTISDIEDLAIELSKNAAVDAKNICVLGERYGGTIALATAALSEFPFKCMISVGGVTDIEGFLKFKKRYNSYDRHAQNIGNKIRQSMEYSPSKLVEKIETPILLIHGEADKMVEVNQSRQFHIDLVKKSASVKYVEIKGATHNMDKAGETQQVYEALERYLGDVVGQ